MPQRRFEKMQAPRAPSVCWKKWAAKHDYEELKEGARLEPGPALLHKKAKGGLDRKAS